MLRPLTRGRDSQNYGDLPKVLLQYKASKISSLQSFNDHSDQGWVERPNYSTLEGINQRFNDHSDQGWVESILNVKMD